MRGACFKALLLGKATCKLLQNVNDALHLRDDNKFIHAVAAIAARAQVGAGEAAERELRAIGATAEGQDEGFDAQCHV